MQSTLLLSQSYEPLTIISWQEAITKLTLGKVELIETYDDDVRSVHLVFKMPAVVRLINRFRRHKKHVRFSRQSVLARDRWKCQYCGQKKSTNELTFDHVVPRAQGGRTCWENIVSSCGICNSRKANKTPEQAGMRLIAQPIQPDWVPIFTLTISRQTVPDQWASYLYWTSELKP